MPKLPAWAVVAFWCCSAETRADETCGSYDLLGHHDRAGSDMPSGVPGKPWAAIKQSPDPKDCARLCCEYQEGTVEGDTPCVGFLWVLPADAPFCSSQAPVNCGPAGGACPAWHGGCCFLKKDPIPPESPKAMPSITCGSIKRQKTLSLGVVFCAIVLVVGGSYLAGGVALAPGAKKASLRSHPHFATWMHIRGLVEDGVAFSRGTSGGRYMAVVEGKRGRGHNDKRGGEKERPEGRPTPGKSGKSNGKRGTINKGDSKSKSDRDRLKKERGRKVEAPVAEGASSGWDDARVTARQLEEQRDQRAHSSQQKIQVVGL